VAVVESILAACRESFEVHPSAEISLEANPGNLSLEQLAGLRRAGVNRLSLGMQSSRPNELDFLDREHDFTDVIRAVAWARQAGFASINLDLIFGLPEQALASWKLSLEDALRLRPDHLSLYGLTLEHGTPLGRWAERGLLPQPDQDSGADMYEWAEQRLADAGNFHYEISNWAQSGHACRHNLQYWRNLPYLGFGAGAHGYAGGARTANVLAPEAYIQRCSQPPAETGLRFPATPATASLTQIDVQTEIGETMMTGLRLTLEGVEAQAFARRFGKTLEEVFAAPIRRLTGLGLLEWAEQDGRRLRLTARGRLLGNRVFAEFI
jgi:oxygen-independent coproporphyrinogen-3 oxidase